MTAGLAIRDLRVHGEQGRTLLDIPALTVQAGETVCVRGPSGAGKSTLLFAIAGLVGGVEGDITWAGQTISGLSPTAAARFRRDHMGLIFQDYLLFEELDPLANASLTAAFRPA
ncbi:MAG: ATP-binding cassette domain-containing protein, partial [Thalassobaculaceae bacterium]